MNKHPIYIISKGRHTNCITALQLQKMNVKFTLVVEPQEYDDYKSVHKNILVTPFSNLGQGSIPVRNFVKEHSTNLGEKKHWILDDNIAGFYRLNNNVKNRVVSGAIFKCCEDFVDRYDNIGIAGMNYHSFCKSVDAISPFNFNTRIYSCIMVDNESPFEWRGKFNEDTDLSLRILKSGKCTVLFNAFLIDKVTTQRMKGGNTNELYEQTDKRWEFAKSLEKQHPDVVKTTWKFNRWHHHVDYSVFKQKLIRKDIPSKEPSEYGMYEMDYEEYLNGK
jgi:hypothetical protein